MIPLTLAVSGLIAASIAGLILNLPVRTVMIDDGWLAQITERADWDHVGRDSARDEFRGYVDLLVSLRTVNRRRARVLVVALLLEVGALALLAVGAVVALVT